MFNWGYEFITPMSIWLERFFRFSLVYSLKNSVRGKSYINQYETDLANYCRQKGDYKGIIVGHIHHNNMRKFDKIEYMCCGDFVDTCSAIVEKNGFFQAIKY
jgi:UDP-2,3-diacylglucosamine pyrophosphatase LpxH